MLLLLLLLLKMLFQKEKCDSAKSDAFEVLFSDVGKTYFLLKVLGLLRSAK